MVYSLPAMIGILLLCCLVACSAKPPVRVLNVGDAVVVDVETLGEYPTTISRVRLTNPQTHSTIWEIKANSGTPQLHAMILREGDNSVSLADPDTGTYTVVSPPNSRIFRLERGVRYELELWREANSAPAHLTIRLASG
jgi:hypothetical protein